MLLVEYSDDYDDKDKPFSFRKRVFLSSLDGKHITEKDVEELIKSKSFKKLDGDDAVSLCCIGILQLVLLGLEDRYVDIGGVPIRGNEYYTRHLRCPRIVAWTSNKKFYRPMLHDFLHGGPSSFQRSTNNSFFNYANKLANINAITARSHNVDNPNNEGWLSGDIEILIRSRPQDADWTVSKSGTACVHPENNWFLIQTDPHIIGMLDGSTRPYTSWKNVNWVYMPINVGGNHWVTDRMVEINNLMVLHDHPLIDYGKYAIGCMTGVDMKKCVHLKSVEDEFLMSMEDKRQLMTNYRDM
nr:hypothetical protein [Tanacetum cinerariifolium]